MAAVKETLEKKPSRVKLIIDEQVDTQNTGANTDVFIGVNGKGYLIKRTEEAVVPYHVYEALKNAVTTIDMEGGGTKDIPRFAYRVLGFVE